MNLRISCTLLESFRLYMDQDWMDEGDLIASIKGQAVQTPKMLLGIAFGRAIEKADKYRRTDPFGTETYVVPVMTSEGWREYVLPGGTINACLERFDRKGVFEVKHTKSYGGVTVVAKADQILGMQIIENKVKTSQFDFDRYNESYQWRFMLDIFGASGVTYNVFCVDEGDLSLKSIETFNLYPYDELHSDCCDLVRRFLGYLAARNLEGYLVEKDYTQDRQQRNWPQAAAFQGGFAATLPTVE